MTSEKVAGDETASDEMTAGETTSEATSGETTADAATEATSAERAGDTATADTATADDGATSTEEANTGAPAPPAGKGRSRGFVVLAFIGIFAIPVLFAEVYANRLATDGALVLEIWLALVAIVAGAVLVRALARDGRRVKAVAGVVVMALGLGGGLWLHTDRLAGAWARFHAERAAFARVVALVRQGGLGESKAWSDTTTLPDPLCYVSVDCRIARLDGGGSSSGSGGGAGATTVAGGGAWGIFLPDWVGSGDAAAGYAHFDQVPTGTYRGTGFGADLCATARLRLGGGWWWMERCGAAGR